MKQQITTLLTTIIVAVATVLGVSTFGLPRIQTHSGVIITKDTKEQVVQEHIEEFTKTNTLESAITDAIATASPSVVSIIATKDLQYYLTDPISYFLGVRPQGDVKKQEKVKVGGGSGIIVSKDGYIITNKHVVADTSAQFSIITADGDKYNVAHIRRDPLLDIALLHIVNEQEKTPSNLIPAQFTSLASPIRIGQFVVAIGNALTEYENTATFGIISAKNRTLADQQDQTAYIGLYQTDSSINPGNSGGPLLATNGQVIGMNTAIAQGEGIGFSLPLTKEFIQATLLSLQPTGSISRPYLGISTRMLTKSIAKSTGLTKFQGVYVVAVEKNSPAEKGGVLSGDIITEVNGQAVQVDMPLLYTLYTHTAEESISVLLYRNNEYKKLDIQLTEKE